MVCFEVSQYHTGDPVTLNEDDTQTLKEFTAVGLDATVYQRQD